MRQKWGFVMNIKTELLKEYIADYINNHIEDFEIDANKNTNTVAINILAEIQKIIKKKNYSDFEMIEEIVKVFEKYKLDFGSCNDF